MHVRLHIARPREGLLMNDEFNGLRASLPHAAAWRKSTYSNPSGNCVEVASLPSGVALRDSRFPDGPALVFTRAAWDGFLGRVNRPGESAA